MVIYHEGWTRLRCKVIGFPPVLLPVAAAPALPSPAVVVAAAAGGAGFRRLESESSVDASPSSRVLFAAAPMIATPAAPPLPAEP
jgi:hypothetical protein